MIDSMDPQTDGDARATIRGLGYPAGMTKCMLSLFDVMRLRGALVLDAYEATVLGGLSDEFLRQRAGEGDARAARVLARRTGLARARLA